MFRYVYFKDALRSEVILSTSSRRNVGDAKRATWRLNHKFQIGIVEQRQIYDPHDVCSSRLVSSSRQPEDPNT